MRRGLARGTWKHSNVQVSKNSLIFFEEGCSFSGKAWDKAKVASPGKNLVPSDVTDTRVSVGKLLAD